MLLSRLSKTAMRATPESEMGMSIRHFSALHSISGSMPQQQLAETLCIDANNTVLILNELETLGWVRRERDPLDRRRHLVVVTDEGQAVYRRAHMRRCSLWPPEAPARWPETSKRPVKPASLTRAPELAADRESAADDLWCRRRLRCLSLREIAGPARPMTTAPARL